MSSLIVIFHTPSNAGYAMTPLERMFFNVCSEITGDEDKVHFAFKNYEDGNPESLPDNFNNMVAVDSADKEILDKASSYIRKNNITSALCFDLQPRSPVCDMLRLSGVRNLVSYWGAPISSRNSGLKLFLKYIDVALSKNKPDMFIFESQAMRELGIYGRGIRKNQTRVIPTGVDTNKFSPDRSMKGYVANELGIPENRRIIIYSGHMERRKGVHTLVESAINLIDKEQQIHWHYLICGNRPGEEEPFISMLENTRAMGHVTFSGYRSDINKLIQGSDIGVVASTEWDSFPMSCLEMAACGLPLIVSDLQGLTETIEEGVTGYSFPPGDSTALTSAIIKIDQDDELYSRLSSAARNRIQVGYSLEQQYDSLLKSLKQVFKAV